MPDPTRPVGSELAGRYRIDGFLKKGGMGAVYRATHLMLNRQVALKLIKPELVDSEDTVQRFEREAKAASQLDHPNIVTIHDLGRADDGTLFIAMELVDGRSLRELVAEEGALAPERAAKLARGIARALARAHSRGIVHRDLKPQNVMVAVGDDDEEVPKLLDFGIAKSFETDEPALTRTGMVVGTPQYMSPEQAQGLPVDARTDLYALGVILYEMLAGNVPFQDTSVPALLVKHLSAPPPSLNLRRPGLPPALVAIVERLLAKQPGDRYAGAEELVSLLAGPFDAGSAPTAVSAAAVPVPLPTGAGATTTPPVPPSPPPPAPLPPPTPAPAGATPGPATAESVAPAPPAARPRHAPKGPSPLAVVAVLAVLALAFAGVVGGAWYWLSGRGDAGATDMAAATETDPATAEDGEAGTDTEPAASAESGDPGSSAASGASVTPAGDGRGASGTAAPAPRVASGAGPASGGTSAARTPSGGGQATAPPPVRATPPPPPPAPASPPVALGCSGVPDGCAALQRALHDSFESAGLPLTRPDRAEVVLTVQVEEIEARSEQQFGTTFVVRTYSVSALAEAPRFDEMVPMPAPDTIRFDTRFGAEKLNEGSRVFASSITDRIEAYWGKRVP